MTDPTLTAVNAVSSDGQQSLPAAQPTAQQVARFEAHLQAGRSYEAPPQSALAFQKNWHSVMSGVGHVAEDFRTQFAESFKLAAPDAMDASKPVTVKTALQMLDKSTRMSYSAMNFQLLGTAERVTEDAGRTLYQQQS
jgi:hypothetical protein